MAPGPDRTLELVRPSSGTPPPLPPVWAFPGPECRPARRARAWSTPPMHETHDHGPPDRTIPTTCQTRGCRGFCNLRVSKIDGEIVPNLHDGPCVLRLDRTPAAQLFDALRSGWDDLIPAIPKRSGPTSRPLALWQRYSLRVAWSSHHSGHGGKMAQLCLTNHPTPTRSVRSATRPACPVNRLRFPAAQSGQVLIRD